MGTARPDLIGSLIIYQLDRPNEHQTSGAFQTPEVWIPARLCDDLDRLKPLESLPQDVKAPLPEISGADVDSCSIKDAYR